MLAEGTKGVFFMLKDCFVDLPLMEAVDMCWHLNLVIDIIADCEIGYVQRIEHED